MNDQELAQALHDAVEAMGLLTYGTQAEAQAFADGYEFAVRNQMSIMDLR